MKKITVKPFRLCQGKVLDEKSVVYDIDTIKEINNRFTYGSVLIVFKDGKKDVVHFDDNIAKLRELNPNLFEALIVN